MKHADFMAYVRERFADARRSSPEEFRRWEQQAQTVAPIMRSWAAKLECHLKWCGPCQRNMSSERLRLPNVKCSIGEAFATRFYRAYYVHHQAIVQLQKLYHQVQRLEPVRKSGKSGDVYYDALNRRSPKRVPWQTNPRHYRSGNNNRNGA